MSRPRARPLVGVREPDAVPFSIRRLGEAAVADWEERAAILEADAHMPRLEAESAATRMVLAKFQPTP